MTTTLVVFQEVEDVDRWLAASDVRERFLGPLNIRTRLFKDPGGSNRVGMIVEASSPGSWQEAINNPAVIDALRETGAKPLTMVTLVTP